jgi:predicted acyltransferase (DUF342 family)
MVPLGHTDTAGIDLTFTAADVANKNDFLCGGKDLIVIRNAGSTTRKVTVDSVADKLGRTQNITAVVEPNAENALGPIPVDGWMQITTAGDHIAGNVSLEADHADVEFSIVPL